MFEIPRRGRQARNFECSENSRSQIVFQIDIFAKIGVGCPWLCRMLDQTMILPGEIKDTEMSSFSSDFQTRFFMNYWWVWEVWSPCEWTVRFFVRNGIPSKWRNMPRAYMLCGFKPVCLYSYHLFILLAVKTILYSIRKNRSRINYYILIAFDYFYRKCAI